MTTLNLFTGNAPPPPKKKNDKNGQDLPLIWWTKPRPTTGVFQNVVDPLQMGISALFWAISSRALLNLKGNLWPHQKNLEMSSPLKQVKKVSTPNRITETNLYPILVL